MKRKMIVTLVVLFVIGGLGIALHSVVFIDIIKKIHG